MLLYCQALRNLPCLLETELVLKKILYVEQVMVEILKVLVCRRRSSQAVIGTDYLHIKMIVSNCLKNRSHEMENEISNVEQSSVINTWEVLVRLSDYPTTCLPRRQQTLHLVPPSRRH